MVDQNTVLILGAGASHEYGFPTGKKLIQEIGARAKSSADGSRKDADRRILSRQAHDAFTLADSFHKQLKDADPRSIDWFLREHDQFSQVGKKFILEVLLDYEQRSQAKIFEEPFCYTRILDAIRTDKPNQLALNKLKIITFNYDRSLPHFLHRRLKASYKDPGQFVEDYIANQLQILHVYGRLGELPWETSGANHLDYGYKFQPYMNDMTPFLDNIKIIGEDVSGFDPIKVAKENIKNADRIIFMGFGFHKENLEVLDLLALTRKKHRIFATGFDLSDPEKQRIAKLLQRKVAQVPSSLSIVFGDRGHTCNKFLKETVLLGD